MQLKEKDIKEINEKLKDSWNNGIFKEPYGVPDNIKEYVVYMRIESGGSSGGNCWGDIAEDYSTGNEFDYQVLDLVIEKINPNCTFLEYRRIQNSLIDSEKTNYEYYGNCTEYRIKFIPLDEVCKILIK